jgi:hypothetical protein
VLLAVPCDEEADDVPDDDDDAAADDALIFSYNLDACSLSLTPLFSGDVRSDRRADGCKNPLQCFAARTSSMGLV